ncbi:hypothetical protein BCS37_03170 [Selenomonas sp. oral taxon 920]|nr:hypothetical protein BCS37_03170 [Selenomonas sp. oral taxon 920]
MLEFHFDFLLFLLAFALDLYLDYIIAGIYILVNSIYTYFFIFMVIFWRHKKISPRAVAPGR